MILFFRFSFLDYYGEKDVGFLWHAEGKLIQRSWDMFIPVSVTGSIVDYEFTTTGGDIEFHAFFSSKALDGEEDDVVVKRGRVPSDLEPFKVTF